MGKGVDKGPGTVLLLATCRGAWDGEAWFWGILSTLMCRDTIRVGGFLISSALLVGCCGDDGRVLGIVAEDEIVGCITRFGIPTCFWC